MTREDVTFALAPTVPFGDATDLLSLARLAAEGVHGESAVRLGLEQGGDPESRTITVGASTDVGRSVVLIFTRFLARDFGEESFVVRRHDPGGRFTTALAGPTA